ncbi:hypothetical protein NPIL_355201 [Nephila pilipes]|uniref:Uncharacterized protein n=1 Tax=Nephila pilipes TaxID=299642 RepID=A0A8X6NC09_NEPPI|nr:hypothetical protein NPIL_355201 [Nephila pilipes]
MLKAVPDLQPPSHPTRHFSALDILRIGFSPRSHFSVSHNRPPNPPEISLCSTPLQKLVYGLPTPYFWKQRERLKGWCLPQMQVGSLGSP